MPPTPIVRRSRDAWYVVLNELVELNSNEYFTCVSIFYVIDQQDGATLRFVPVTTHRNRAHPVDFSELPDMVQQAAVDVYMTAIKMKDGRITRFGNRINLQDISEYVCIVENGYGLEEGFQETDSFDNRFSNLRL